MGYCRGKHSSQALGQFFTRVNSSIEKGPSSMSRLSASRSTPTLTGGAAKQVLKMIEPLVHSFFRACTTYSSTRGLLAAAYLVHDPPGLAVSAALTILSNFESAQSVVVILAYLKDLLSNSGVRWFASSN